MIDKKTDPAAAVPAGGKLSAKQILELKELAKTRGDEIEKRLRASRDPFSQLEFALAKRNSREIERQINLGFSDARAPEAEEPTPKPTEDAAWACKLCSCTKVLRNVHVGGWFWSCDTCGNRLTDDEAELVAPRMKLKMNWATPLPDRHRMVKVFDHDQLLKIAGNRDALTGDAGDRRRIETTLAQLLQLDEVRPLALPGPAYEAELEELAIAFPAFERVISEAVSPSLAVLAAGGLVRPAPVLLVGAPGIGKTFFVTALARVLGVPLIKQDMSSTSTGASLSGLSVHWSNSSPGCVFKALAFGRPGSPPTANTVVMLDELDKAAGDPRFDVFGPLHALLEEDSSKQFEDESLPGIFFDASHIRWIGTANTTKGIPSPILSRMHVIEIEEPTSGERVEMASRIYESVVRSMQLREFADHMPDAVLTTAARISPREFRRHAQIAVGKALTRGDIQTRDQDFNMATAPTRKMGF